jgi:hypothetical protein
MRCYFDMHLGLADLQFRKSTGEGTLTWPGQGAFLAAVVSLKLRTPNRKLEDLLLRKSLFDFLRGH